MASAAHITGASVDAPLSPTAGVQNGDALDLFERLYGQFDTVGALLRAISSEVGPDKVFSLDAQRLLSAAEYVCERCDGDFGHAIAVGYAERAAA